MADNLPEGFVFDGVAKIPEGFVVEASGTVAEGLEGAAQLGGTIAGTIAGGLTALVDEVNPFTDNDPQELINQVRNKFIVGDPSDNVAMQQMSEVLELTGVNELFDSIENFSKRAANKGLDVTGSPAFATFLDIIPEMIGEMSGFSALKSMKGSATVSDITRKATRQSPAKRKLMAEIKRGSTDAELARFKIQEPNKQLLSDPKVNLPSEIQPQKAGIFEKMRVKFLGADPRLVNDELALEAIKQGFDEGVLQPVKQSSKVDKAKMLEMVNSMEAGKKNKKFAMRNRPSDIVGKSLTERVQFIIDKNKESGRAVDRAARRLKGKQVEFDPAVNKFIDDLEGLGIKLNDDLTPNFYGSDIEGLAGIENIVSNIIKRMRDTKAPDAFDIHRMKRFIDENVTYGKKVDGMSGRVEEVFKSFRRDLDSLLDNKFKAYDEANTKYAETITALDNLQASAGSKLNLSGASADKALGTELRKLMSNYRSRVNLLDSLDEIEGVYKKYGGTADDDILTQTLFVDELNNVFGTPARTSAEAVVERGTRRGIQAATGGRAGAIDLATDVAAKTAEKARGINQKNAFKAIKKLLQEQNK